MHKNAYNTASDTCSSGQPIGTWNIQVPPRFIEHGNSKCILLNDVLQQLTHAVVRIRFISTETWFAVVPAARRRHTNVFTKERCFLADPTDNTKAISGSGCSPDAAADAGRSDGVGASRDVGRDAAIGWHRRVSQSEINGRVLGQNYIHNLPTDRLTT